MLVSKQNRNNLPIEDALFKFLEKNYSKSFSPSVNTREDEKAYFIEVDLPGVKKDDISVSIEDGNLVVSGEREMKEEVKKKDYYRMESSYGKFMESFALPENANVDAIDAKVEDGVLNVVIPKVKEEEKKENAKKIEVK